MQGWLPDLPAGWLVTVEQVRAAGSLSAGRHQGSSWAVQRGDEWPATCNPMPHASSPFNDLLLHCFAVSHSCIHALHLEESTKDCHDYMYHAANPKQEMHKTMMWRSFMAMIATGTKTTTRMEGWTGHVVARILQLDGEADYEYTLKDWVNCALECWNWPS